MRRRKTIEMRRKGTENNRMRTRRGKKTMRNKEEAEEAKQQK